MLLLNLYTYKGRDTRVAQAYYSHTEGVSKSELEKVKEKKNPEAKFHRHTLGSKPPNYFTEARKLAAARAVSDRDKNVENN